MGRTFLHPVRLDADSRDRHCALPLGGFIGLIILPIFIVLRNRESVSIVPDSVFLSAVGASMIVVGADGLYLQVCAGVGPASRPIR